MLESPRSSLCDGTINYAHIRISPVVATRRHPHKAHTGIYSVVAIATTPSTLLMLESPRSSLCDDTINYTHTRVFPGVAKGGDPDATSRTPCYPLSSSCIDSHTPIIIDVTHLSKRGADGLSAPMTL